MDSIKVAELFEVATLPSPPMQGSCRSVALGHRQGSRRDGAT